MSTPLIDLINEKAPVSYIEAYIEQNPDSLNERDVSYSTPLHEAVEKGNIPLVELLIDLGADVHAVTESFVTPLHIACGFDYIAIAQILIEKGASIDALDGFRHTPLQYCFSEQTRWHLKNSWEKLQKRSGAAKKC